jgi:hypothetical protein
MRETGPGALRENGPGALGETGPDAALRMRGGQKKTSPGTEEGPLGGTMLWGGVFPTLAVENPR